MKYNFYSLKTKVQNGESLPEDINASVHNMLINKLGCAEASEALRELERSGNCGGIQIFCKDAPKYIKISTNYGMVEGYDLCEDHITPKFSFTVTRHIKNPALEMSKPWKKVEKNERKESNE